MAGKQILTTFDPVKGRGEKLPTSDYPNFGNPNEILSPQEAESKNRENEAGARRPPNPGPVANKEAFSKEITFKNLIYEYGFSTWSLDGKGIYLCSDAVFSETPPLVYAGLNGEIHILWKRGTGPGNVFLFIPIPSPDGRHLAVTLLFFEMNAWLLENF